MVLGGNSKEIWRSYGRKVIDGDARVIYCLRESLVVIFMAANNSSIQKKSRFLFIDELYVFSMTRARRGEVQFIAIQPSIHRKCFLLTNFLHKNMYEKVCAI